MIKTVKTQKERKKFYRLVKKFDDEDIPTILSVYKQPSISHFISIDEELLEYEYRK